MKRFLFLILLLPCQLVMATDWYVREDTTHGGNDDGTSYADAWQELGSIVWGGAGVVAGDELWVSGLHLWADDPPTSAARNFVIDANGTDEDTRIIIRGDHPGDPGIIWGVQTLGGGGGDWTQESGNVYSFPGDNYNDFFFENVTATSWNVLSPVSTTTGTITGTWTWTNGSKTVTADGDGDAQTEIDDGDYIDLSDGSTWYIVDGEPGDADTITITANFGETTHTDDVDSTRVRDESAHIALLEAAEATYWSAAFQSGYKVYTHTTGGGDPSGKIQGGANGWYTWLGDPGGALTTKQYITFLNLDFYVPVVSTGNGTMSYIRWEGCTIWYDAIDIGEGNSYIEFIDCDRAYGTGGFGFGDNDRDGIDQPHHCTVRGCTIHDIGVFPIMQNGDAEGISVNGSDYLTVESNEFYNCGSAYTCFPFEFQTNIGHIIRWNYIHDSHQLEARGRGIEFQIGEDNVADKSGCEVYGNIVSNIPSIAYRSTWPTVEVVFYNNTAVNAGQSFWFNHTQQANKGPNIILKNNISLNPVGDHIFFGSATTDANYTLTSDFNMWYPDGAGLFELQDSGESPDNDLAGWQALVKAGCTFDPSSTIDEPELVGPARGKFAPRDGSPVIGAGVDVGLSVDFRGNPIGTDIGAITYTQYGLF